MTDIADFGKTRFMCSITLIEYLEMGCRDWPVGCSTRRGGLRECSWWEAGGGWASGGEKAVHRHSGSQAAPNGPAQGWDGRKKVSLPTKFLLRVVSSPLPPLPPSVALGLGRTEWEQRCPGSLILQSRDALRLPFQITVPRGRFGLLLRAASVTCWWVKPLEAEVLSSAQLCYQQLCCCSGQEPGLPSAKGPGSSSASQALPPIGGESAF